MTTTLSVTGTPGRGYSFSLPAGSEATTALSVMGTPGGLRIFAPKTQPIIGPAQVTDLSVWAIPGKLRAFTPKAPAVTPPEPPEAESTARAGGYDPRHQRILREDEEILAVIMAWTTLH